jgi:hypothetical protein
MGSASPDDLQARIDEAEQLINAVAFTVDDPVMGTADGLLKCWARLPAPRNARPHFDDLRHPLHDGC